ncbi:GNAT family N-acetyltransferase [Bacillus spongiae]|uniref:GNAT family N-acetyltransferase n=1 Tax=Bacillus spongiae TaxID=2683610 RepID=A0ABU8HH32_9BACI
MNQLRTDLTEVSYLKLFQEMKKDGYQLFALSIENEIVSLAGIAMRVNFYNKRHIYIYDLITSSSHRSKGYGERLLNFIHTFAKESGAEYVALESGLNRVEAHRFYEEKLDYDKWCYSFRKKI